MVVNFCSKFIHFFSFEYLANICRDKYFEAYDPGHFPVTFTDILKMVQSNKTIKYTVHADDNFFPSLF